MLHGQNNHVKEHAKAASGSMTSDGVWTQIFGRFVNKIGLFQGPIPDCFPSHISNVGFGEPSQAVHSEDR